MIEPNPKGEVWIFAEQESGQLHDTPLELCSKARGLADELGVPLAAVLVGKGVRELSYRLISGGVDKVYLAEHPMVDHYQTQPYAKLLCNLIETHKPQIVLFGATVMGRDLAPRVASQCRCGLTADCTDLQIGDHEDKRAGKTYHKLLYQIRPAFGGNIIATIVNTERWPQMATVREGVMPMSVPDSKRKGQIIDVDVNVGQQDLALRLIESHREAKKVNLKGARTIVAGGAGVGSRDSFQLLWDLANALGGAVAGSRAAVDSGFIPREYQVGQTGTTVRPALYIAVGISGAVQHRVGMEESGKIIAINWDANAPIFQYAHYGIVGDLNVVLPKMIAAVKARV
ncbi:MAG: Caffeyl-CoA reductase-Etf complex subunit CarE [Phycisphaerae bacterium]|nr:Caffeyl-CoA reductase-Etf complex subunit CarE [Phycisphaerae bacterium]